MDNNTSIIIAECMTLRDDVLATKHKGFLNLEIESDSKIVIYFIIKKNNIPIFIMLLMVGI